jgi:small subunit ribosomal protein S4
LARYTGPVCRQCRREGIKLFLKGIKCLTDKCPLEHRNYPPGQHGQRRVKVTEYGVRLREKQKLRRLYGVLERQFRNYFYRATRMPGLTGENLVKLLERRLDNVVHRMGFASSRKEGRQMVRHCHFMVNGRKVDIPSYLVKPGDVVEVRDRSKELVRIQESLELAEHRGAYSWLEVDAEAKRGVFKTVPQFEDIPLPVDVSLVVELYSK